MTRKALYLFPFQRDDRGQRLPRPAGGIAGVAYFGDFLAVGEAVSVGIKAGYRYQRFSVSSIPFVIKTERIQCRFKTYRHSRRVSRFGKFNEMAIPARAEFTLRIRSRNSASMAGLAVIKMRACRCGVLSYEVGNVPVIFMTRIGSRFNFRWRRVGGWHTTVRCKRECYCCNREICAHFKISLLFQTEKSRSELLVGGLW